MRVKGEEPLIIIEINDTYILGVYQGTLSEYDLLLCCRQKDSSSKSGWSRIRTPKQIHWAVDVLIKMHYNEEQNKKFLNFLISQWDNHINPINSDSERNTSLDVETLKNEANSEATKYPELANKGEYSIKFLYLIANLLMIQQKTNLFTAYMFRNLLKALEEHNDIYEIVAVARDNRR